MCTTNEDRLMYGSWAKDGDFFAILGPLTLLTTWKIKLLENWKKHQETSFYNCVPQMTTICMVPEHGTQFFVILGHFLLFYPTNNHKKPTGWQAIFCSVLGLFCPFTSLLTPKIKIWKKCKKHLEMLSFYTCEP